MINTSTGSTRTLLALLLAPLLCSASISASVAAPVGAPVAAPVAAQPPAVRDVDGRRIDLAGRGKKATVLIFVAHDCPISNAYAPEYSRLATLYSSKKVAFALVYPERGLTAAQARRHAREYSLRIPLVLDGARRLARFTQARVTPEAAVLGPGGALLYRGRIDDRFAVLGRPRPRATRHDLRAALDAVVAGKPVASPRTTATGCFIEG